MSNYYIDFVGLNTFVYETSGFDPEEQFADFAGNPTIGFETVTIPAMASFADIPQELNHIGFNTIGLMDGRTLEFVKH